MQGGAPLTRALAPVYRLACCGSSRGRGGSDRNLLSSFDWAQDFRAQLQRLADAEGISTYSELETERRTLAAYYLKRCETMDDAMSLFEELGAASEKAAERIQSRSAGQASASTGKRDRKEAITYRATSEKADSESERDMPADDREVLNEILSSQRLRAKEIELRVANEKYRSAAEDLEETRALNERLRDELSAVRADLQRLRDLQAHPSNSSSAEDEKLKKMMQLQGEKYASALKKLSAETSTRKQLEVQLESTRAELEISKDRILQLTRSISFVAQASSNGVRKSGDDITCLAYHLENLQLKRRVDLLGKGKDDLEGYVEKMQLHIKRNRLALERSIRAAILEAKQVAGTTSGGSVADDLNTDRTIRLLAENAVFRMLWSFDSGEALNDLNGFHLPPMKEEPAAPLLDLPPASSVGSEVNLLSTPRQETPVESVVEKVIEKGIQEADVSSGDRTPRSQSIQQALGVKVKNLHGTKKAGFLADKLKNLLVENKDVFI